ncbi:hypothetical protein BC827DRAFT_1153876 [Russula dissimulans]|nr:hypothetical protein BC827DRAFT_1153876 [Russula dissimulans]
MDLFTNTPQTITPSNAAVTVANNLRIASITIAAYDYLITIPAEIRLYKSKRRRYSSFICIITANFGFFYHHFSSNVRCQCVVVYMPDSKAMDPVIQVMASQAILGARAYFLSKRNSSIGITLLLVYIAVTGVQWFTNLYDRIPVMINGDCSSALAHPHSGFSTWTFYLSAMLFDFLALFISTFYLLRMKPSETRESTATKLWKMQSYHWNLWVISTESNWVYSASLGVSVTWIMSQRIILHPLEARTQKLSAILSQLPTDSSVRFYVEKKDNGETTDQTMAESLTKVVVEIDNATESDVNFC